MKKILITGGAGFIGSSLALELIDKGYIVTVLDSLSKQIHGDNPKTDSFLFNRIDGKVIFIEGSVTSKDDWLKALKDQDSVIHLAAETGTGQSMYEIQRYCEVNVGGTALLLDILTNESGFNIKKIIIASSRSIYGEGKYLTESGSAVYPTHRKALDMDAKDFDVKMPGIEGALTLVGTDEDSKIHPSSVYGITKQNQEQMVMTVCQTIGIEAVAFRYQNVYGPGQSLSNPYTGILSIFSTLIRNGKDINIFEDGKESRDFVYIDDVVGATIMGLEKAEANGEIFNVGTGVAVDVLRIAEELIKNYGINVQLNISGNYRLGDIRHNFADLKKIRTLLNFNPEYNFESGIKHFCDWVKTQDLKDSKFDESVLELRSKGLLK
jgi:dTDP-L-rhamnose 4-epimerase